MHPSLLLDPLEMLVPWGEVSSNFFESAIFKSERFDTG
jgi:hypothetical protein